ncbi:MAG: hypothetical protein J6112_09465 [Clostridia bacterium]|nr:hypothetical protein [Clostridia bacterium]
MTESEKKKIAAESERPTGKEIFKLVMLGIAGGLVGALPYMVLRCGFGILSVIPYILCGGGAAAFYLALGHGKIKGAMPHIILVADTILSVIISDVITNSIAYVLYFEVDGKPMNFFQKLAFFYFDFSINHPTDITPEGVILQDGTMSIYVVLIGSLIFALIGLYAAILFITLSEKHEAKKRNKKPGK